METLHNGFTLSLSEGAFPLSTDSIALGGFVQLKKDARVLDLEAVAVRWGFSCAPKRTLAM